MTKTPQFESVYKKLSKPVLKFIAKRIGTKPQVTEEVFEETMTAAWKGWNTFKHKSSYFTWICRIALNKIADYYRGQVHERSRFVAPFLEELAFLEDDSISPEERMALQDLRVSIRKCLNVLPEEKRNLLYLRYWEEMSIKQIAKQSGISERSVEGKIYRAKLLLKDIFTDKYPEISKVYSKEQNL
jgi:RNA polymerase sigma-70 factor (ECF subfamily)